MRQGNFWQRDISATKGAAKNPGPFFACLINQPKVACVGDGGKLGKKGTMAKPAHDERPRVEYDDAIPF